MNMKHWFSPLAVLALVALPLAAENGHLRIRSSPVGAGLFVDGKYVLAGGGALIRPAAFKNHTDLELALIEALVGRTPPFPAFDNSYGSPRRY